MSSGLALVYSFLASLSSSCIRILTSSQPRPSLHLLPGTTPLTIEAAILPPLLYYVALLFLPPPPPEVVDLKSIRLFRDATALLAGVLFFRLPLAYHVPQSIGLTYQLGLVGLYGGCRVFDAFFISPRLFGHIPRRVTYTHIDRDEQTDSHGTIGQEERVEKLWSDGGLKDPFGSHLSHTTIDSSKSKPKSDADLDSTSTDSGTSTTHLANTLDQQQAATRYRRSSIFQSSKIQLSRVLSGPSPTPVYEHARTEPSYPTTFTDRASWALELETSMRGMGFTWTTADVRHTRKTWLPTVNNRVHSIVVHVLPVQLICFTLIRTIYMRHLATTIEQPNYNPFAGTDSLDIASHGDLFDRLSYPVQLTLTLALGAFLMSAFSLGHSLFAILLHPLSPSPLAFFPPLYTTRVWELTSVRHFWSFGWHRLFARLFLVYGVWPGEWIQRTIQRRVFRQQVAVDSRADVGKVLGAFASSAFVHSFCARGVLAGSWRDASGEARFFAENGVAVVVEGVVVRCALAARKKMGSQQSQWYDRWVGRVWWISAVVWTGRNFARGWVKSGLVREMAFR